MGQFYAIDVIPDCIGGNTNNNSGEADIDIGDVIFDWTPVQVPAGNGMIQSISAIVNAEDGAYGAGSLVDYELLFAKSLRGSAPPSLGTIGGSADGVGWQEHLVGATQLESSAGVGTLQYADFHVVYNAATTGNGANGGRGATLPLAFSLDPSVRGLQNGHFTLYVAAIQVQARNYGTGVLANGAVDASSAESTTVTVDGVNALKIFSVGDTVWIPGGHGGTQIPGTLTNVEANTLTFSVANTTVDIADNAELLTQNPIRIKLGVEV